MDFASGKWQATRCPGSLFLQGRFFDPADLLVLADRTAGVEAASCGRVDRAGYVSLQQDARPLPLDLGIGGGHRRQQGVRVGVHGLGEQPVGAGLLHDLAQVHDGGAVADVPHHGQIVGDEQIGEAEAVLQLFQEVQHLRLDGDVERRHRLVKDQETGVEGQRPRHPYPLALPARELVGVTVGDVGVHSHQLQQPPHRFPTAAPGHLGMHLQQLADGRPHRHAGVEGGERILEDDLHVAAQLPQPAAVGGDHVDAFDAAALQRAPEHHLPGGGFDQAEDAAGGGGLAASRLAHQAEGASGPDVERHARHRRHLAFLAPEHTAAYGEVLYELPDGEGVETVGHLNGGRRREGCRTRAEL